MFDRDTIARAIWKVKPDSLHKPFPPDSWTDKERRAYQHNPIAALDLCYIYADAVLPLLPPHSYAHMCRDEHLQIGHTDSEHEQCPLCRALGELERLYEKNGWQSTAGLIAELRKAHD